MRLPAEPVVRAAARWLEVLPSSAGVARAQSLLTTHPRYSDLTPTQYAAALDWLRSLGLLDGANPGVPVGVRLLTAVFENADAPWIRDADELVREPDDLPPDVVSCGAALGLGPEDVFGELVARWGKVDAAARAAVGAAGELALVELLTRADRATVDHVSTWSDGFGYDVRYVDPEAVGHLEVKSSTRSGRFTAYLSRHEHGVMTRDEHWQLVVVRLTPAHELAGVGSVARQWVVENTPRDRGPYGSWSAVKLDVPPDAVTDGIPRLGRRAAALLPCWK